jgi:glycosyltransferase involved in cell wall biosynthesis
VALTTFNSARYLEQQLDSIAAQDRQPDELVIGDDQSTDQTAAIVERFAARQKFPVHWQRNPSQLGASANFESVAAVAAATSWRSPITTTSGCRRS